MKKHVGVIALAILVIGALLIYAVTYQVDELKDVVLIETFGKVTRTLIGNNGTDAGLHFKWPWPIQKAVRYDARTFVFEDTHDQISTNDGRYLIITLYCAWRIEDPEAFHRSITTSDPGQKITEVQGKLRGTLRSEKKNVVGDMPMAAFINTDPRQMRLAQIEKDIQDRLAGTVAKDYGVKVVRVGIKSLGLSDVVSKAVIGAMKERPKEDVERYKGQGEAQARAIEARAMAARDTILAFARRKATEIRTRGDQAVAEYYAHFREDPELATFLAELESIERQLAGKTQIILDGSEATGIQMLRKNRGASSPSGQADRAGSAPSSK